MLYALITGGAAYLDKDGAYPGIDGAFDDAAKDRELDEKIARYRIVAGLQEKVAKLELVRHEFDETDWRRQKSVFADGRRFPSTWLTEALKSARSLLRQKTGNSAEFLLY